MEWLYGSQRVMIMIKPELVYGSMKPLIFLKQFGIKEI